MKQKLNEEQKQVIRELIEMEVINMQSQHAVAVKCGVSDAVIDGLRKGTYKTQGDEMYIKVGTLLGWNPYAWQDVDNTLNSKVMKQVCIDAKEKSMFMAIASKAGGGKSTGTRLFRKSNAANNYYIQCREWTKKEFFIELCKVCGVDPSPDRPLELLLEKILAFFKKRVNRPLLVIDQANSLKPSVLSFLIYLYNDCEDQVGVVVIGTEHLMHNIKRGVKRSYKGYDELDSRLGRNYVQLPGAPLADVKRICAANGITDESTQKAIFKRCSPVRKPMMADKGEVFVEVVEDLRRLKREIQTIQLTNITINETDND